MLKMILSFQVAVEQLPTLIPLMITQLTNKKVDDETKAKLTEILQGAFIISSTSTSRKEITRNILDNISSKLYLPSKDEFYRY